MNIQTTTEGKATLLAVQGKLDALTAPEYEQKVNALLNAGDCFLVIDFSQLDYISSAGLRALLVTAKRIQAKGGQLHFASIAGPVMKVFEISGFRTIFRTWDSVADALAAIG